jgi:N-acetylmuramoyl-L-alanine amidase
LIVLHYTAMNDAEGACRWLCNPESQVSSHYLVTEVGAVWSLVEEADRAWHAGAGTWGGLGDINSRSIGIEISNAGTHGFAAAQMDAVEALVAGIMDRWDIPAEGVIGHSDFAPGRKIDPGGRFDWRRLALGGLAVWSEGQQVDPDWDGFRAAAVRFGYPVAQDDVLLATMRMRFRPWARGPLDAVDMGRMCDLAARYPAVRGVMV